MAKNDFISLWAESPKMAYAPITVNLDSDWSAFPSIGMKRRKKVKVIFNDPATILFVDDKKFVSKAHKEKFDEEKGLLMCIAKANGISHLELKRIIKNAQRPENKKENK